MRQTLRPDQVKLIADVEAALRGPPRRRRPLLRAPTGYGKTTLIAALAERAQEKGSKLWVIVHRIELAKQAAARLTAQGVDVGIIRAGESTNPSAIAQVVSVDTIARRLSMMEEGRDYDEASLPPPPALAFVDEAHHVTAPSWQRVLTYLGDAIVIGLSATPWAENGDGLPFFDTLIEGPHPRELIGPGLPLVDADIFVGPAPALDQIPLVGRDFSARQLEIAATSSKLVGDVVTTWQKRAAGKRTICFAVSKKHSQILVDQFLSIGVPAAHVDDATGDEDRARIFEQLRRGELLVVSNVGIVTEGFDAPAVEACILARATKSERLYLQAVGRALRATDGKSKAIVLDHGNNTLRHGHPFAIRVCTLATGRVKQKRVDEKKLALGDSEHFRVCPACLRACAPNALVCECGYRFGRTPKSDDTVDLKLLVGEPGPSKELKAQERRRFWHAIKGRMTTPAAIALYKKRFGISPFDDVIFKKRA